MAADIALSSMRSSLSCWEAAGYVGLLTVVIGVAGEGVHDFTSWFKTTWWGPRGDRLSVLILIVGLAIEGVAQVKANSMSGQIIANFGTREVNLEVALEKARADTLRLERDEVCLNREAIPESG